VILQSARGRTASTSSLDHAEHVVVAGVARAADAPQVDLVRLSDVAAIDDVAPVHEPWSDDQLVDAGVPAIRLQRGRQLGARVTTQHDGWADVPGVPAGAGHVIGVVTEAIVVRGNRDDGRASHVPDRATPCAFKRGNYGVQERLHRVLALSGVGQIAQSESAAELVRGQIIGMSHEGVSNRIAGW
jgi:hypothetical protein